MNQKRVYDDKRQQRERERDGERDELTIYYHPLKDKWRFVSLLHLHSHLLELFANNSLFSLISRGKQSTRQQHYNM